MLTYTGLDQESIKKEAFRFRNLLKTVLSDFKFLICTKVSHKINKIFHQRGDQIKQPLTEKEETFR